MTPTCPHCGFRPATHTSRDEVDGIIRPACDVCDPANAAPVKFKRNCFNVTKPRIAEAIAAGHDTHDAICTFLGFHKGNRPARHSVSAALQHMLRAGQLTQEPIDPANPHYKRWALTETSTAHKKPWSRRAA